MQKKGRKWGRKWGKKVGKCGGRFAILVCFLYISQTEKEYLKFIIKEKKIRWLFLTRWQFFIDGTYSGGITEPPLA